MPVFLLLKQHNKTKKYYLCKRTTNDIKSLFTYNGSGKKWKNHLKKHGKNFNTVILDIAKSNEELKQKALFYNKLWKVGNNNDFLNMRPEEGDGGNTWQNCQNLEERKYKISTAIKLFNTSSKGKSIRRAVGQIAKQYQTGKTMQERVGHDYIDARKGKKFSEIYKDGYKHPQQKPFQITLTRTGESWTFNNESEFKKVLNLNPDPTLRKLKEQKILIIKQVKSSTKHSFLKGDILTFEYLNLL